VKKNAPIVLAQTMSVICALGQTITTALMGTAILRDVQLKSHELLFTTRVTRTVLGGRFVGPSWSCSSCTARFHSGRGSGR